MNNATETYSLKKDFTPVIEYTVVPPKKDDDSFVSTSWRAVLNWLAEDDSLKEAVENEFRNVYEGSSREYYDCLDDYFDENAQKIAKACGYVFFENVKGIKS